jgi:hypothetical protein
LCSAATCPGGLRQDGEQRDVDLRSASAGPDSSAHPPVGISTSSGREMGSRQDLRWSTDVAVCSVHSVHSVPSTCAQLQSAEPPPSYDSRHGNEICSVASGVSGSRCVEEPRSAQEVTASAQRPSGIADGASERSDLRSGQDSFSRGPPSRTSSELRSGQESLSGHKLRSGSTFCPDQEVQCFEEGCRGRDHGPRRDAPGEMSAARPPRERPPPPPQPTLAEALLAVPSPARGRSRGDARKAPPPPEQAPALVW